MAMDPYAVLEVDPASDAGAIKVAYHRLAKLYHPDANPGFQAEANERLKVLNAAYELVKDGRRPPSPSGTNGSGPGSARGGPSGPRTPSAESVADRLDRLGAFVPGFVGDRDVIVAVVEGVLSAATDLAYYVPYATWDGPGGAASKLVETTVLRLTPETGLVWSPGWGPADETAGVPPTHLILGTRTGLIWTTSRLERVDGVVVEEHVTALTVAFDDVLGAKPRKRGRVEVWVDGGATLGFTVAKEAADGLAAFIDAAV
jgi:hypothetical protein